MKKLIIATMGICLSSCAGKPVVAKNDAPVARNLASDSKIIYTTDTKEISLCGNSRGEGGASANYIGQVQLVSKQTRVYTETVRVRDYGKCETVIIEDGQGKGDWKGFYGEIPGRTGGQASQLQDAIKGVGDVMAYELLPYFRGQPKPKSWREFADRINSAAQDIKRRTGKSEAWKYQVLGRYKQDNIVSLGYLSASVTACPYTETDVVVELGRDELQDLRAVAEVRIRGGKLLPDECEKHYLTFDGRTLSGRSDSYYNSYRDQSGSNSPTITFQGLMSGVDAIANYKGSRAQVTPEDAVDNNASSISVNNSGMQIYVAHPLLTKYAAIPEFAQACKLSMTATIRGRTGSFWNSKTENLKTVNIPLNGTANGTFYDVSGVSLKVDKKGNAQKPEVSYTTSYGPGCPFFSTRPSTQSLIGG